MLNQKLVEKNDFLQSIIDKEASANTYYYNYPPKSSNPNPMGDVPKKVVKDEDSEIAKLRKMYED